VGGEYRAAQQHGIQMGTPAYTVTFFEISGARIVQAENNGILIQNSSFGTVTGNSVVGCKDLGIQELGSQSNDNLIMGNWLYGNLDGPLYFVGSRTQAIRNWAQAAFLVPDSGGFRETVDGWHADDVGANVSTPQELNRFAVTAGVNAKAGRFRAVRNGWITGVVVTSTAARSSGTLTVTVWINPGLAEGVAGLVDTGVSATLDATNTSRRAVPWPAGDIQFLAGDELFLQVTTSGWGPTTADIRCAFQVEDRKSPCLRTVLFEKGLKRCMLTRQKLPALLSSSRLPSDARQARSFRRPS
jgi:hypothetical protein